MENKQTKYVDTIIDDKNDWYAIRLYTTRQEEVAQFFTDNGIETFIPKQYVAEEDKQGRVHQKLKPVVRNLIFVKKLMEDTDFKKLVNTSNLKMSVLTKADDNSKYSLIPHGHMYEFRLMCNPDIYFFRRSTFEGWRCSACEVWSTKRNDWKIGSFQQEVLFTKRNPRYWCYAESIALVLCANRIAEMS